MKEGSKRNRVREKIRENETERLSDEVRDGEREEKLERARGNNRGKKSKRYYTILSLCYIVLVINTYNIL